MLRIYDPKSIDVYRHPPSSHPPAIDEACDTIRAACKGLGTDEAGLIKVLTSVSPFERELIACRYKEKYDEELAHLLKSETSGDFGFLLQLISVPLVEAEAFVIRQACKGLGTTERYLYPVLLGRSNDELFELKRTFFDKYSEDLSVLMDSELGGDFKKVILAALQGTQVDFNTEFHTKERAEQDAEDLYNAGQGKWGTDEETFIKILFSSPPHYIELLNDVYCQKYGNGIVIAIEKEFGGDAKRALLFYVRLCLDPFALLAEHFESTMKGLGTDEKGLSAAVVRYQPWLREIGEAFEAHYNRSLTERIHGETSGDYRALLLALFDAPTHCASE
ncbi:Annexin protein, partial [Globisporangium splendens]